MSDLTDTPPRRPCHDPDCPDFAIHGTAGCLVHIPSDALVAINRILTEAQGTERRPVQLPPGLHGYNPNELPDNPDIPARPY